MKRALFMVVVLAVGLVAPVAAQADPVDGLGAGGKVERTSAGTRYEGSASYVVPAGGGRAEVVLVGRPDCGGCYYEFVVACSTNMAPVDDLLCIGAAQICDAQGGGIPYRVGFYPGLRAPRENRGPICRGGRNGAVTVAEIAAALPVFSQDSMGVADPRFEVRPASGALVNLPLIVHAAAALPVTKTFALLGFEVQVTATPAAYDWSFSNGEALSTATGGRAFDGTPSATPGYYVSSTFTDRGTATVGLTQRWSGEAVVAGLAPFPLPQLSIPGPSLTVPVREARSRLVGG